MGVSFDRIREGGGVSFDRILARKGGCPLTVENYQESHKPVGIGYLRAQSDLRGGEAGRVQDGPLRPSGAILEAEKGYSARRRGLGTAFHPAGRVPEPEAFLARRIGRGYLLRLVEEDPA